MLTRVAAPWAFYPLPTRSWELALGAILSLAAFRGCGPRPVAAIAGGTGVAMIVAAGALLNTGTPFPGTAALLPTIGAALVVGAGLGAVPAAPSRLLALPPLRWLGRISYSLYLWHWPMLVIPAAALGRELPFAVRILLAAATIPIAAASQRWVEEPIRRGRFVGVRARRSLALAGVLTVVLAGSSLAVGAVAGSRLGGGQGAPSGPGLSGVLGDALAEPRAGRIVATRRLTATHADPHDRGRPGAGRPPAATPRRPCGSAPRLRRRLPRRPAGHRVRPMHVRRPGLGHHGRPLRRLARGPVVPDAGAPRDRAPAGASYR